VTIGVRFLHSWAESLIWVFTIQGKKQEKGKGKNGGKRGRKEKDTVAVLCAWNPFKDETSQDKTSHQEEDKPSGG